MLLWQPHTTCYISSLTTEGDWMQKKMPLQLAQQYYCDLYCLTENC